MQIPTANVVVGFSREMMDRLFTQGATYKNLIQGLTVSGTDNVLLFDSESNPNFISFEHSFAIGASMRMRLVLIDPTNDFETRFFTDNVVRNVAGWSHQRVDNPHSSALAKKMNEDTIHSLSKIKENKFYSQLAKEYQDHYGNKEIFIAYGIGNNLDLWSGPHRVILTAADISVKGPKKITLDFTPTENAIQIGNRRGAYNEKVNINLAGLLMRYSGESRPINFIGSGDRYMYNPLNWLDSLRWSHTRNVSDARAENVEALAGTNLHNTVEMLKDLDIHSLVVDTLRSYIQKATGNPNVIVLLPNINIICRQFLESVSQNVRLANIPTGLFFRRKWTKLGRKEAFVKVVLNSFGLELCSNKKDIGKDTKAISTGTPGRFKSTEKAKSASEAFSDYFSDREFTSMLTKGSRTGIPDHAKIIKEVIDKIREHSKGEYQTKLEYLSESDIKILNFWSHGDNNKLNPSIHYTFGGYHKFDEKREAIIVGDMALIKEYLYGGQNINEKYKTIKEIKDKGSKLMTKDEEKNVKLRLVPILFGAASSLDFVNEEDAALQAVKEIPLHPLDKVILGQTQYNKIIRDIVFPPLERQVGSFGDVSYIPDEFAYSDVAFSDEQKKYIKEKGISVFRYNTQNPNILDMKFKFGPIYMSLLKEGFQKEITRRAAAVAEGILPVGIGSFPIRSKGAALGYLKQKRFIEGTSKQREKILTNLAARISNTLVKTLNVGNAQEAASVIETIIEDVAKNDLKGYVAIDQELPGNPFSITVDMMEQLYRKALQMTIKTLPTFHLSHAATISSPCIVFAQDAPIKKSQKNTRTLMNTFFSGLYKIMGFRHTIKGGNVHSEFRLTKNSLNMGSEDVLDIRKKIVEKGIEG